MVSRRKCLARIIGSRSGGCMPNRCPAAVSRLEKAGTSIVGTHVDEPLDEADSDRSRNQKPQGDPRFAQPRPTVRTSPTGIACRNRWERGRSRSIVYLAVEYLAEPGPIRMHEIDAASRTSRHERNQPATRRPDRRLGRGYERNRRRTAASDHRQSAATTTPLSGCAQPPTVGDPTVASSGWRPKSDDYSTRRPLTRTPTPSIVPSQSASAENS